MTDTIKQKKGLKRNTIDKYYTKTNIVEQCIEAIKNNINISRNDLIIEPSAGNGSFMKGIKILASNFIFYDLEPENNEIDIPIKFAGKIHLYHLDSF
jgi:predicted RNA methylase